MKVAERGTDIATTDGGDSRSDAAVRIVRRTTDLDAGLSDDELQVLVACEDAIEQGMRHFLAVGEALITVRDGRLYRDTFDTFEEYLRVRWGLHRARGYQFIQAVETVRQLLDESTNVDTSDLSESHLRELARIIRHKWGGVDAAVETLKAVRWQVANNGGKLTAQAIRRHAERHGYAPAPQPPAEASKARPRPRISTTVDDGRSLADILNWAARQRFDQIDTPTRAALVAFIDAHLGGVDAFARVCAAERREPSNLASASVGDRVRFVDATGMIATGTLWSAAEPSGYWVAADDGQTVRVDSTGCA